MTSGWTGGTLEPRGSGPRRTRRRRPAWLPVALILALIAAVFGTYQAIGLVGDRAHDRRQSDLAQVATHPGGLIDDLQNERNLSILTMTGLEDLVTLSVDTIEEARSAVDSSTAAFDEVIGDDETAAAAAYDQAMDALSELAAIRGAVDRDEGPGTLDNLEPALRIYDRYSEVIATFMDGTTRLVVSLDDDLRRGVKLIDLTSRQIEAATVLATRLAFAAVEHGGRLVDDQGDPVERELVAEVRWLTGDLRRRRSEISELATGEYAAATITALRQSVELDLQDLAESLLEGGTYTIDDLFATVEEDPNSGYRGLLSAFEGILSDAGS